MRKLANYLTRAWIISGLLAPSALCGAGGPAQGDGTIPHADARTALAVPCSFHVTVFVLEYFGLEYPAELVSAGLPLIEKDASLADVQQMIEAFGLETFPRTGASVRQVAKSLDRRTLGIISLAAGELNHYYVVALDNQGRPVLANVPHGVSPLSEVERHAIIDEGLEEAGGVVLFVRKRETPRPPMADQIRVDPSLIELGEFFLSGREFVARLDAEVSLTNVSSLPIMISRIQTSCGCTDPDWTGGLLRAGESRRLQFAVYAGTWGRGKQEKAALIACADGSKRSLRIRGTAVEPEERHRIHVSQSSTHIDFTEQPTEGSADFRVTRVRPYGAPLDQVTVTTEAPWMSPRLVPTDQHSGDLRVRIDVDRVWPEVAKSSNRVVGTVRLSTRRDVPPVEVTVVVFRRDFFRLSRNMIRLPTRGRGAAEVSILPNDKQERLEVVDVRSESPSLSVKVRNDDGVGVLTIQTDGEETISPGYYLVECDVESSLKARGVAKLVVDVREPRKNSIAESGASAGTP
jgi:hypothetical protein